MQHQHGKHGISSFTPPLATFVQPLIYAPHLFGKLSARPPSFTCCRQQQTAITGKSTSSSAKDIRLSMSSSQSRQGPPASLAHYLEAQVVDGLPGSQTFDSVGSSGVSAVRWGVPEAEDRKADAEWVDGEHTDPNAHLSALAELSGPTDIQPNQDQQAYNPESAYNPTSAKARAVSRPKPAASSLTPAEKKANHVKAEQKRRANIRFGYELLCNEVPELREALLAAGHGRGGSGPGGGGAIMGKKTTQRRKKDEVPVIDEHGTRIDGRQGPRSESVILQKTVDHTRRLQIRRKGLMNELARLRAQSNKPIEPNGWEGSWDMSQVIYDEEEDV